MYKGVERDEARRAEKAKQKERQADLERNKAREEAFQKVQPTAGFLAKQKEEGGPGR